MADQVLTQFGILCNTFKMAFGIKLYGYARIKSIIRRLCVKPKSAGLEKAMMRNRRELVRPI